jgi:hypothetical protein
LAISNFTPPGSPIFFLKGGLGMTGKGCIIIIKDSTKKALAGFKFANEDKIMSSKDRRFISWDDVILYLLREGKK